MKLFGRDQDKDNVEKSIIYYYAKRIGIDSEGNPLNIPREDNDNEDSEDNDDEDEEENN